MTSDEPDNPVRRDGQPPRPVTTIVGPTGVGKTAVGIAVARAVGGEIVSADSRQIYRGMDVGTAKPSAEERAAVRHHLVNVVEPSEVYDAARFASEAESVIGGLLASGVEPLVVGGTGFYIRSLFEGLFEGPGRDDSVRAELDESLSLRGVAALHEELREVDPETAERLHPNDSARIVRALEVYLSTGTPLSAWHDGPRREPAYAPRYFGLTMPRERIYEHIDRRVDHMMDAGLAEEVRDLVVSGRLAPGMPGASAVGYRELLPWATGGDQDLESAVGRIKLNTRRYAKRQLTWFNAIPDVVWLDLSQVGPDEAADTIAGSL